MNPENYAMAIGVLIGLALLMGGICLSTLFTQARAIGELREAIADIRDTMSVRRKPKKGAPAAEEPAA